jgi:leucyl-tRNA synthetase
MEKEYRFRVLEEKWRDKWEELRLYRAQDFSEKPKFYLLVMFPYPSGAGLHVGHTRNYVPADVVARFKRMNGFNVLHPIGYDAFGLPAENYAIEKGVHPRVSTEENIIHFRNQLKSLGLSYDWDREFATSDPSYYKWTEWFFEFLYKRGLAYENTSLQWWCPHCKTVLANEQIIDGKCWRCDTPVEKKELKEWFFRITDYADRLIDGLEEIEWPDRIKSMQSNWVGKSDGTEIFFKAIGRDGGEYDIPVFTTRADTIFGVTFLVIAPEHPLLTNLVSDDKKEEVSKYVDEALRKVDIDRLSTEKEKTGVFVGSYAVNPVNGNKVPIFVGDYVVFSYGTGAVMGVPAHDERDFAFALKYGLPIIPVIRRNDDEARSIVLGKTARSGFIPELESAGISFGKSDSNFLITLSGDEQIERFIDIVKSNILPGSWVEIVGARWLFIFAGNNEVEILPFDSIEADRTIIERCRELEPSVRDKRTVMEMLWGVDFYRELLFHAEYGTMIHSGDFSGTSAGMAVGKVNDWLEHQGVGEHVVRYRMRDWLISRQRYWGAPIPVIHCKNGETLVPEEELPVLLPDEVDFSPRDTGESPLANDADFVNTTCPIDGMPARRETDTQDGFACSSWYYFRYADPRNDKAPFGKDKIDYWLPVDLYIGGAEHAVMHLLYSRFYTKVMHDAGMVGFDEPFKKLLNQGMVLGADHQKMSKSRGNTVDPDEIIEKYGADTLRTYILFMGPLETEAIWSTEGINGAFRFVKRVWSLFAEVAQIRVSRTMDEEKDVELITDKYIQRITDQIESFKFNTMVSAFMEWLNYLYKISQDNPDIMGTKAFREASFSFIKMIAPVTPFIAEELWEMSGNSGSVHETEWPSPKGIYREEKALIVLEINGKVKDKIEVPLDSTEEEIRELALKSEKIKRLNIDFSKAKFIYVKNKLLNIVVKD